MCGLIYSHNFKGKPVNGFIFDRYKAQKDRGQEGFGVFDGKYLFKAAQEDRIVHWLSKTKNYSDMLLFHHRMPTSTVNTKRSAHPFTTGNYFGDWEYVLAHNGSLGNDRSIHYDHEKLGIHYQTMVDGKFNDSEALLWDFALYMQGEQEGLKVKGAAAFICIRLYKGKPEYLYFGRNDARPLKMDKTKKHFNLSSEGKGQMVTTNMLHSFNYQTKKLTRTPLTISNYEYFSHKPDDSSVNSGALNGNWLPQHLSQYKGLPKTTPRPIPVENRPPQRSFDWDDDDWDMQGTLYEPTSSEIENCAFRYLQTHYGKFEQAYWALEADYSLCENRAMTQENLSRMKLLQEAIEWIQADPEYLTKDSVSSLWEDIWNNPKLLTA